MLSAMANGYSSLQVDSLTMGTATFISLSGQQLPPEWRVPQPDTVQSPSL